MVFGNGNLDSSEAVVQHEVTDVASYFEDEIVEKMSDIRTVMNHVDEFSGCACKYKSSNNHCSNFEVLNPGAPDNSVYKVPNLRNGRLKGVVDSGVESISDIDVEMLTDRQREYIELILGGEPIIDIPRIQEKLKDLVYPLHFIDYETYEGPVPVYEDAEPFQLMPYQFSLHKLDENGDLDHAEYLANDRSTIKTLEMVEAMTEQVGDEGTLVVWNKQFESDRNKELARLHPEHTDFLLGMNDRMFDLNTIFKEKLYQHPLFEGKHSLKIVLPVLCPDYGYDELDIPNGLASGEAWITTLLKHGNLDKETRDALLEYCKLDTLGMVLIYQHVLSLIEDAESAL